ncbi:MAG: S8 family serine peptidase [Rickettsiales bacterium]
MALNKLLFSTALTLISINSISVANAAPKKYVEGRLIVQANAGVSDSDFVKSMKKSGLKVKEKLNKNLPLWIVEVPVKAEEKLAKALSKNKHVKFAEVDAILRTSATVNDPYFSSQWETFKIQAPQAWDITMGEGVTVAVLDTGVYGAHPDLSGNVLSGWNVNSANSDVTDNCNHGTPVSGSIAAVGNNGIGMVGVASKVKILPVKITNSTDTSRGCPATCSDVDRGLSWAVDNGADIANISYAGVLDCSSVLSVAQYMQGKGGLVFNSASNTGTQLSHKNSPYLVTVSATNSSDVRPSWSSYGSYVDLSAPGQDVFCTGSTWAYGTCWGTSFSSPITAAVAALVKSANPALTSTQIEQILKDSADDIGATGYDIYYGYGRVNAYQAVELAKATTGGGGNPPPDTTPPLVAISSPASGSTLSGTVYLTSTASDNVGVEKVDYYINGTFFGSASSSPYRLSWDTTEASNGNATITAYAIDTSGNTSTASNVSVVVSNQAPVADEIAPVAKVDSPNEGDVLTKISKRVVTIKGSASDNVGVKKLSVLFDGKNLCSSVDTTTVSCNLNTKKVSNGSHVISVIAEDAAGNVGASSINVTK